MQVTWETASSLPAAAIEEFEKQLMPEVVQHVSDDYGHSTSTILVQEKTCGSQPSQKARKDRPFVASSTGLVFLAVLNVKHYPCKVQKFMHTICPNHSALVDDYSTTLACNTEKDRHIRLNFRTAGMAIIL